MTALKIAGLLLATFGMFFLLACAMTAASKYDATILRVSDDHWLRAMARQAGMPEVRIYFRSLPFDTKIGAYALYLPWERSIVFNSRWLFGTPKEDLVFITAHELAHHVQHETYGPTVDWADWERRERDADALTAYAYKGGC